MFDSHSHLHFSQFDHDRNDVLKRASQTGVRYMLLVGCDQETNQRALDMASLHDTMWATVGIHPHEANSWSDEVGAHFLDLILGKPSTKIGGLHSPHNNKIVAIGEIGLDYFRNLSPRDIQIKSFREQLQLAKQVDLPVIVHCRDAHEDVFNILVQERMDRVLFHCFSGDLDYAHRVLEQGWYISFSATVTYPRADALRKVAVEIPLTRMLVETDCPYLPPQSHRGKRNEPAYLKETVEKIASIRAISFQEIDTTTEQNTKQLFLLQ